MDDSVAGLNVDTNNLRSVSLIIAEANLEDRVVNTQGAGRLFIEHDCFLSTPSGNQIRGRDDAGRHVVQEDINQEVIVSEGIRSLLGKSFKGRVGWSEDCARKREREKEARRN